MKTVKSKKSARKEKNDRRKPVKERPESVIIHPTEGRSYADVLRNIRRKIKPEESEVAIHAVWKAKTGGILIDMGKEGRRHLTTTEVVLAAVQTEAGVINSDISIRATGTHSLEQKRAFVSTSISCAKEILKLQRIRIGWKSCRIMVK